MSHKWSVNFRENASFILCILIFSRLSLSEDVDPIEKCEEIAKRTEGLSGREISKLGVAWQVSCLSCGFVDQTMRY